MSSLVLMLCNAVVYAVVSTYSLIPSTYVIPATLYTVVYAPMYAMLCTCSPLLCTRYCACYLVTCNVAVVLLLLCLLSNT